VRVVLAESSDLPARRREIGAAVAADLTRSVQPRHRIGIACGDLLTAAVDALAPMATVGVEVVQAVGWTGDVSASLGAMDLVERLARRIGGAAVLLPAPGVVTTEAVRRRLEADQHVAAALRALDTLDTLYVEIAWLGDAEIAGVRRALGGSSAGTAVGTVAQRHFDARGTFLRTAADRRVIGVTVEQMRRARHVVAVASAPDDAPAVAAALRTGIVRTLITDEPTARAVAELDARDTTARRHPRRLNS
jgi:DNA-binding transcriptional regulator LsrR (DeoR family)